MSLTNVNNPLSAGTRSIFHGSIYSRNMYNVINVFNIKGSVEDKGNEFCEQQGARVPHQKRAT